jgi:hypothetical protein
MKKTSHDSSTTLYDVVPGPAVLIALGVPLAIVFGVVIIIVVTILLVSRARRKKRNAMNNPANTGNSPVQPGARPGDDQTK